jgi:2,4-dienoyl-CoA reductase-like NADH-dependent reductase (Old Yellow Enzyme family)
VTDLFVPLRVGELELPNRIVMAPMTRCRASEDHVPSALMAEYYAQRASAGLILTEATVIAPQGVGYPRTPGIWSDAQVEGWRLVTRAVHAAGGRIMLQLWHVGRVSHPHYLQGELPVAPSAIAPPGQVSLLLPKRDYVVPRALTIAQIAAIVAAFRHGAVNAQRAGFDGVELHGANGYLLDQFLQDGCNRRTDAYGGSIANRARFMLECTDACIDVWGPGRVGMHLAPRGDAHGMGDSDRLATFGYVAEQLGRRGIAFLCTREAPGPDSIGAQLRRRFGGVLIANERYDRERALQALAAGAADAVAFGKDFISNPDLPRRLRDHAPLTPYRVEAFYWNGATDIRSGYTDYPHLPPQAARAAAAECARSH